jgi:CelD/BcsL family acetyltransferase involved in cellulose biosynthesis
MRIQCFTDISGFDQLAGEWDDLLARALVPSIFLTHRWQRIWWEHLGHGNLLLIAVRDDAGCLAGIAPLFCPAGTGGKCEISFIGCVDVSDYLDVIVDRNRANEVYRAFWSFLASQDAPAWDALNLCNIPQRSPTHTLLAQLAQSAGYHVSVTVDDVCPVITLPASWDDYLGMLDKKQRHEVRRKVRRAEESAHVRWYAVEGGEGLDDDIESFIGLHQKSTAAKEDFWDEAMKAFFRVVAKAFARAGWLKLYFIEFDGERAATFMCFDYRNEILIYNSGYDPARFAHLSPGIVLNAHMIEHAIQLGRSRLDFLRGDEEYKFRFGALPEPVHRLRIEAGSKE